MAEVELQRVTMRFGEHPALADLSLHIREGEFLTLLGPSGCGKSTTLNLIAGLLEPTSGDIVINGKRVNGLPPRARRVAMVFQDYALYPHMSVFENLAFPLRALRMPDPAIRERVDRVAGNLGIAAFTARLPKELSGGQRQRVALGRALVRDPQAFLMDEPLSNLDARLRVAMRAELKRLHRQLRATMIYVTHDQAEAMTLSDRIAILRDGFLQQVASPREIYERPANQFVAAFMGAIGMNFIRCRLAATNGFPALSRGPFRVRISPETAARVGQLSDREVVVGLRPEHVLVERDGEGGLPGVVEIIEYLGAETLAHVRVGETTLVAKMGGAIELVPDQSVQVRVEAKEVCLFDPVTETRISAESDARG